LIHNERTKLTATMFNTMATALVAAGLFAPAAAVAYGVSDLRIGNAYVAILVVVCVAGAATLHWAGRRLLGSLRE
jgi:FtsH-binding integral membrane protein